MKKVLNEISYWKNPVWTRSKIKIATKNWFKYLEKANEKDFDYRRRWLCLIQTCSKATRIRYEVTVLDLMIIESVLDNHDKLKKIKGDVRNQNC